ncbi:hypothetical protein KBD34_03125 [Patescibacteria group bacterium]|nr:hypothetical protein [Patescibacteria group bacterium]
MFHRHETGVGFCGMIVLELLRAELEAVFSRTIRVYQADFYTPPSKPVAEGAATRTRSQGEFEERHVEIRCFVGPLPREPWEASQKDRASFRLVRAVCRLFNATHSVNIWEVHFLEFQITDEYGRTFSRQRYYYEGRRKGSFFDKDAENPLMKDMRDQVGVTCARQHNTWKENVLQSEAPWPEKSW